MTILVIIATAVSTFALATVFTGILILSIASILNAHPEKRIRTVSSVRSRKLASRSRFRKSEVKMPSLALVYDV